MKTITIYTKDNCAYCVRAKTFFKERNLPFEERYIAEIDEMLRLKRELGWATFPIILVGEHLIGGYDDMKRLDEAGELLPLLKD